MTITTTPDTAPAVARRPSVLPRLLAIAAALALWWLVTGVLAGPESLLRDFGPQHVPSALHALHER
ncbi:ABC transporter permease, partial [Nocardia elegans]|nr:ABC transporter permease [Nocardia elegans]